MTNKNSGATLERTTWLRPTETDFCFLESRTKLLMAISEAGAMGFFATRDSLIELLHTLEDEHVNRNK